MGKGFKFYVNDWLGWFYDENGTRRNLYTILTSLLGGSTISSDLVGVGDITVGTEEVEIEITGTTKFIRIQADIGNSGVIYIGKTGVLSDGSNDFVRLKAGEETLFPYDDSTNPLYAISDTGAQTINVGALL